ncbi:TPA: toll/interleukin-1 receptor domain-containing protein, partial [Citrobacter braakii]
MAAPKVFVSHASEDKDRFVMAFAERLRANGVDAWVDKWEIQVGDSLVRKIFSEGLAECSAIIVVLSNYSVNKPWVREEL